MAAFREELRGSGLTRVAAALLLCRPNGACRSAPSPSPSRSTWRGRSWRSCTPSAPAWSRASTERSLLRYLRHEMGHVVNYAYKLYERREWVQAFGAITQPYVEEYRPQPFSRALRAPPAGLVRAEASRRGLGRDLRRVDDAEPRLARRVRRPADGARQARAVRPARARGRRPSRRSSPTTSSTRMSADRDYSLDDFYRELATRARPTRRPASTARCARCSRRRRRRIGKLRRRCSSGSSRRCATEIYRWTGHFPERTRPLLRQLAERAAASGYATPPRRAARDGGADGAGDRARHEPRSSR